MFCTYFFRIKLHKIDKTVRETLLERGTTAEYLKRKYNRYETGPEPEPLSNYMDVRLYSLFIYTLPWLHVHVFFVMQAQSLSQMIIPLQYHA